MIESSTALDQGQDTSLSHAGLEVLARAFVLTVHLALSGASTAGRAFVVGLSNATASRTHTEASENATADQDRAHELAEQLRTMFRHWEELRFRDGVENEVSRSLYRMLVLHSTDFVDALTRIVASENTNPRVLAEAMRHLGRFVHQPTRHERLWLLERGLRASSPVSRDGAALGLAHLADKRAAPYLEAAIATEPVPGLRDDLKQVLDELLGNAVAREARQ